MSLQTTRSHVSIKMKNLCGGVLKFERVFSTYTYYLTIQLILYNFYGYYKPKRLILIAKIQKNEIHHYNHILKRFFSNINVSNIIIQQNLNLGWVMTKVF